MSHSTSTPSSGKVWYILHFEDPTVPMAHDILYLNDPLESRATASSALENTLHSRFDRHIDINKADKFRISRLAVSRPDNSDLQITLRQLVVFLRDLPLGPAGLTIPDLWGFGGNRIRVTFEFVEAF